MIDFHAGLNSQVDSGVHVMFEQVLAPVIDGRRDELSWKPRGEPVCKKGPGSRRYFTRSINRPSVSSRASMSLPSGATLRVVMPAFR